MTSIRVATKTRGVLLAAVLLFGVPAVLGQPNLPLAKGSSGFDHKRKEHQKKQCADCHSVAEQAPYPVKAAGAAKSVFPAHDACSSCHNFAQMYFSKPQFCSACHNGRPTSREQPALFQELRQAEKSDFGIDFSHRDHLTRKLSPYVVERVSTAGAGTALAKANLQADRAAACLDCHQPVEQVAVQQVANDITSETGHRFCMTCHGPVPAGGRIKPANEFPQLTDCVECHSVDLQDRTITFDKVTAFRHSDHSLDIRPRKKGDPALKKGDRLCADCHRGVLDSEMLTALRLPDRSQCLDCHNGKIGLPEKLSEALLARLE